VHENVQCMPDVMAQADLAVCSFGMVAYELAAAGVPAVHLALTDDHARSSDAFHAAGIARALGVHHTVSAVALRDTVMNLVRNPEMRKLMADRARANVDGCGARRIAETIVEVTEKRGEGPGNARYPSGRSPEAAASP